VLDVAIRAGILDVLLDRIFGRAGAWPIGEQRVSAANGVR
jgi:hypothetical protein